MQGDSRDDVPTTDLSPAALIDTSTPLESQPAVQSTLDTQQEHAAVYAPESGAANAAAIPALHMPRQSDGSSLKQKFGGKFTFTAAPHTPMVRIDL